MRLDTPEDWNHHLFSYPSIQQRRRFWRRWKIAAIIVIVAGAIAGAIWRG